MCATVSLSLELREIARWLREEFGANWAPTPGWEASPEIFPGGAMLCLVRTPDGRHRAGMLPWYYPMGPPREAARPRNLFNARSETVREKPLFRDSFARRRCLAVVDAFYEWDSCTRPKTRWRIRREDASLFALGGIHTPLDAPDPGTGMHSGVSLLTVRARDPLARLHHRMPLVLDPRKAREYLDPGCPPGRLREILEGSPGQALCPEAAPPTRGD